MHTLTDWAARWGLPQQAIAELYQLSVAGGTSELSEAGVQSRVRVEASQRGIYTWRNNVGAGRVDGNRFMRWGLANDSSQLNEKIKSGDLIGLRPLRITGDMAGKVVGQFVSRECKHGAWKPDGSVECMAQMAWATLINLNGGDAKITTGPGSFD